MSDSGRGLSSARVSLAGRFEIRRSSVIVEDRAGSVEGFLASTNERALSAADLAQRAARSFTHVEPIEEPAEALAHARALGEPVLVTGSLYLLADLAKDESLRWRTLATG